MKEEIKKRFYDILFETEEDTTEGPITEASPKVTKPKTTSSISAKDILYKDSSAPAQSPAKKQPTAFINLGETALSPTGISHVAEPAVVEKKPEYVVRKNISPIFGVIDDEEPAKATPADKLTGKATITKKTSGYLGTIISPIYGYEPATDPMSNTTSLSVSKIKKEETKMTDVHPFYGSLKKSEKNLDAFSLDDILNGDQETKVVDREIDLFEDLFNGEKK